MFGRDTGVTDARASDHVVPELVNDKYDEKDVSTYIVSSEVFHTHAQEHAHDDDDGGKLEKADMGQTLLANNHLQITQTELEGLEAKLPDMDTEDALKIVAEVYQVHQHDPRYAPETLERMKMFVDDPNVAQHPEHYGQLIFEMRILALLVTTSSAYAEVRAVAADTDDTSTPSLTFRVWVIGSLLTAIACVINAVFELRYPSITVSQVVIQLVSFPMGVFMAKVLPTKKFFGKWSLNPGPFSRKEHMLITCMAGLGMIMPPSQDITIILAGICTNLTGFGFAGLTRRFLIYPSYCVWPTSLPTIALNNALHQSGHDSSPVRGPRGSTWRASMYKCFWVVFGCYFIYYFFPGYMFPNLTIFDWMSWIKPTNKDLVAITSANFGVGLGFNPFPTFDYNYLSNPGGYFPQFIHYNFFVGMTIGMLVMIIFWYTNAYNCGYLQIASPNVYDHKAKKYVVTNVVDKYGRLVVEKFQQYSEPYLSAYKLVTIIGAFAYMSGTITHTLLYNLHELKLGVKGLIVDTRRSWQKLRGREQEPRLINYTDDVHYRLMQAYPEVPEWWYTVVLAITMVVAFITLGVYTEVSPAVAMGAPILTVIFVVPIGIVTAVAGLEPSMNILCEIIGGSFKPGDTMTMQYFRVLAGDPVYQALNFATDLKLGHYVKIPPRHMFITQLWGGLLGTIVTVTQLNWMMKLPGVCTEDAPFRLICPVGQSTYSNAIFWGPIGAPRLFGPGGRYYLLLLGFPLGILIPVAFFLLKKKFNRSAILQATHPLIGILAFAWGGHWGARVPGMFINYFSWNYLRVKYQEFWARYNYVTLAALGAAISLNALITFFALVFPGVEFPTWWGNPAGQPGCIGNWTNAACGHVKIPADPGYFGPPPGQLIPRLS